MKNFNIYRHLDYRMAVSEAIESFRALPGRWSLRKLSEEVSIQPSFLTNVLKGRFDFNPDQLFSISLAMGFSPNERKYLLLLLEYARAQNAMRKQELKSEIEVLQKENQKTEKQINLKSVELSQDAMAEYYLDPFTQLVHSHLNLPKFANEPLQLSRVLGISQAHLQETLSVLAKIGYVKINNGKCEVLQKERHLPRDSNFLGPHQALLRLKSIDQLQRLSAKESYSFSATITCGSQTQKELHGAFLEFLKKAEAIVKKAPNEKIIQMNFDLFPWEI